MAPLLADVSFRLNVIRKRNLSIECIGWVVGRHLVGSFYSSNSVFSNYVISPGLWDLNTYTKVSNFNENINLWMDISYIDSSGTHKIVDGSSSSVEIAKSNGTSDTIKQQTTTSYVPLTVLRSNTSILKIDIYIQQPTGATNGRNVQLHFNDSVMTHIHTTLAYSNGATGPTGPQGPQGLKSFIIDNPIDPSRYLVHVCLEGPEAGVYYRGRGLLRNGKSFINLPDYVDKLAYDFTIHVTPINGYKQLSVSDVMNGIFTVYSTSDEESEFFWVVYAKRSDIVVQPLKNDITVMGEGPYKWVN